MSVSMKILRRSKYTVGDSSLKDFMSNIVVLSSSCESCSSCLINILPIYSPSIAKSLSIVCVNVTRST